MADLETRRPVEPDRTLFRVASVSKLFVATAVMQLVEQGKLELDVDVNRSLKDFHIEEAFGEPVTLRHLLTHTGGFDDRFLYTAEPLEVLPTPLGDYLAARMPPRVMPPGRFISYSNHGYALAGHLVELASGRDFGDYVEQEIFAPLGMSSSSFGIPTPVPPDMARPYLFRKGAHQDLGLDRLRDGPAGDLVTSGSDMARFMLAHLQGGRLGELRLLGESTVSEMQREHFQLDPGLAGWCLGFAAEERNGQRAISHDGSWRGFGTGLTLVPAAGLGWFVSTNHDFHPAFFEALRDGLWDRFFPVEESAPPEATVLDRLPAWLSPRNHAILGFLLAALFVASLVGWAWAPWPGGWAGRIRAR
jgi:CubicO group peptidase (beta-lactamase class C family)